MQLVEAVATVDDIDAFVERLGDIGDEHGVTVQAFDARYVVDRGHLQQAIDLADRAIERGENVARDRAVEILCYAAGHRQINRALTMGVSQGENPAVVLVDSLPRNSDASEREKSAVDALESMPELDPQDTLGEYDPERVRDFFDIGEAELATVDGDLAALVHERVALLDVEK